MLGLIGKGLVIGILVSAPLGPAGMLCIQRTLNRGRWYGFFTGIGVMFSDVIYAALTCLGMGFMVGFIEANELLLEIIGSIVLGLFGYYTCCSNPVKDLRKRVAGKISYTYGCFTGFLLTFSNVLVVVLYIGLFARFGFVATEYSAWMLLAGIICIGAGAAIWWLGVTYVISRMKKWFNIRHIRILNRIVGAVIILLAIIGIVSLIF
ncbi:MAG: LysE family translocator [Tannerellaceae bacterium]|jgi:threonine/homoserine/homoserine lactone efflux protein|nr:LysE family translocator [Tannerellaceae bacterium]